MEPANIISGVASTRRVRGYLHESSGGSLGSLSWDLVVYQVKRGGVMALLLKHNFGGFGVSVE